MQELVEHFPFTIRIWSITRSVLYFFEELFVSDGLEWNLQVESRNKPLVDPVTDNMSARKNY